MKVDILTCNVPDDVVSLSAGLDSHRTGFDDVVKPSCTRLADGQEAITTRRQE